MLWILSLEFGSPPLYAELNRVVRNMDMSYLESLGPLARSLNEITYGAEEQREATDKFPTGYMIQEVE